MRGEQPTRSSSEAWPAVVVDAEAGGSTGADPIKGLWPVDRLVLGHMLALSLLAAVYYQRITEAGAILTLYAAGALLIFAFAVFPRLPGANIFRHWYPLPYIFVSYRVTSLVIPAIWPSVRDLSIDARLAAWDHAIWGVHPTVWLERIQTPLLTELLQITYALFLPVVLSVAVILWVRKRMDEFRSYAFLLALGFLVSYVGYLIVPARGPRFFLDGLQTQSLVGLWLFGPLRVHVGSARVGALRLFSERAPGNDDSGAVVVAAGCAASGWSLRFLRRLHAAGDDVPALSLHCGLAGRGGRCGLGSGRRATPHAMVAMRHGRY